MDIRPVAWLALVVLLMGIVAILSWVLWHVLWMSLETTAAIELGRPLRLLLATGA